MVFQRSRIVPTRPIASIAILVILLCVAAVKWQGSSADGHSQRASQAGLGLDKSSSASPD
jgi:hypothetical protein